MAYIREYTIGDEILRCIPLSLGGMQRVSADFMKKNPPPTVPIVPIMIGDQESTEANPDDPTYQAAFAMWQNELNVHIMKFTFATCILNKPPTEFIQVQRDYFGDVLSNADLQYMWLTSLANDEISLSALSEFIMGSAMATEKGIAQAEATFPGADRPATEEEQTPSAEDHLQPAI